MYTMYFNYFKAFNYTQLCRYTDVCVRHKNTFFYLSIRIPSIYLPIKYFLSPILRVQIPNYYISTVVCRRPRLMKISSSNIPYLSVTFFLYRLYLYPILRSPYKIALSVIDLRIYSIFLFHFNINL